MITKIRPEQFLFEMLEKWIAEYSQNVSCMCFCIRTHNKKYVKYAKQAEKLKISLDYMMNQIAIEAGKAKYTQINIDAKNKVILIEE